MRCSLLTLSTFLDGELATDRAAEVDAHLIGCSRCSTGLGYLREEADRIHTLARVQVPDYSTHQLLAEVGLIASEDDLPGTEHVAVMVAPSADSPPWYSTDTGKALPWDPRHPARERTIIGRPAPLTVAILSDAEPELDFAAPPMPPSVPLAPEPESDPVPEYEPEPESEPIAAMGSGEEEMDMAETPPDTHNSSRGDRGSEDDDTSLDDAPDTAAGDPFAEHGFAGWEAGGGEARNGHGHGIVEVGGSRAPADEPAEDAEPAAVDADAVEPMALEVPETPPEIPGPALPEPEITGPDITPPEVPEPEVPEPEIPEPEIPAPEMPAPEMPAPAIPEPAIHEPEIRDAESHDEPYRDDVLDPAAFAEHIGTGRHVEPPKPVTSLEPPARANRGAMGLFVNRMRDAVSVRLALMRSAEGDLDDNVQIVSGAGAPDQGSYRDRREQHARDASVQAATPAREPEDIAPPASEPYEYVPAHDAVVDIVETPVAPVTPFTREIPDTPAIHVAPEIDTTSEITPDVDAQPEPNVEPGRHMRSVERGKDMESPPWLDFAALRESGVSKSGRSISRARGLADRRLWAIGIAVLGLMVIGLLVGKSVSVTTTPATAVIPPNPTAVASSAPAHASATPAPTVIPTPLPTPPPAPSASKLTNPQTLGAGASGFTVQDERYGSHPNDFRIVFDLTGATGTPKVVAGFSGTTTLYVEFENVTGGTPTALPPGQIVSSARLLKPSPIAGRTIYEFTLTKGANLGAFYLAGPTRLVLDLT